MSDCPSLYELTSASLEENGGLRAHLASCRRCSALLAAWEREAREEGAAREDDWREWEVLAGELGFDVGLDDVDAPPVPGSVHGLWAPASDTFLVGVIVAVDDEAATVLPVSTETWAAADEDVVLGDDSLGYPAMVECWNRLDVLREQVAERVADPSPALTVIARAKPTGASATATGPPIIAGADPRTALRAAEAERVRPYAEPSQRLQVATGLAGVVRRRREEQTEDLESVAAMVDLAPAQLRRLEAGDLDLCADLPVARLGRLVEHLELQPSRRLYVLVEETAFRTFRSPSYGEARAAARRRGGTRGRARQQPEEVRRDHARQYVEALRTRIEG